MKPFKAISKQLFGAHYQQITQSLFICAVLFFSLSTSGFKIKIAPSILFFTTTCFSIGIMWQALSGKQNADKLLGMFMLPFENRQFVIAYVTAFGGYALITKTAVVLAVFFAICDWTAIQIFVALLCACNGSLVAAVWYLLYKEKNILTVILWAAGIIATCFFAHVFSVFMVIMSASVCLAILYLLFADVYNFYQPVMAKAVMRRFGKKGSVIVYLLRYLLTNKNYFVNTFGLWVVACFLPFLFDQFGGLDIMVLGFAVLCMNTPICTLLSCDSDLEQMLRMLPNQAVRFCSRYCVFVAVVNLAADGFYLCSWQLKFGGVVGLDVLTAVFFAGCSAFFSVLLEWFCPIHNWKVESDLWHHPRKYVVPFIMLFLTAVVMM